MKKYKSVMDLGPRQLWNLRKQINLNSIYIADYYNDYDIDPHEVCNFFDGWLDYIQELMYEDIEDYDPRDEFFIYLEKYDNYKCLNEYRSCFN